MMRIASIPTLLLMLVTSTAALAQGRPAGPNCNLSAPPKDAGEEQNHGATLRIFPRAKEISASYSGCQVLFAPDGKSWAVISLTEIARGDPIRVWSEHETDPPRLQCRYKEGKLVEGNPDFCPAPEFILVKSMAPGCVRVIRDLVAKNGLGAKWPKDCEYD